MPDPNFNLLYVDSPPLSARFYKELLGKPPVETSPPITVFTGPADPTWTQDRDLVADEIRDPWSAG